MAFKSKAQVKACWANKKTNPKTTWDCSKQAKETKQLKKLPARLAKPKQKKK